MKFPTTLRELRIRSTSPGTTFCCAAERCEFSWLTYAAEVWTLIAGEPVRGGQLVGRIGNSGNTNEPHLHVSAVAADSPGPWRQAAGVPMTFAGRFLSVNDVVR